MIRRATGWGWRIGLLAACALALYYRQQAAVTRDNLAAVEAQTRQARALFQRALNSKPAVVTRPASNQADLALLYQAVEQAAAKREARLRQLETTLQNKEAFIAALQQAASNRPAETAPRPTRAWLDDLRQSDPRQYAAILQRRELARQETQLAFAEKADFFRARDPSAFSEEERAEYEEVAQLLDETWLLAERLRAAPPAEERRAVWQALRDNLRDLEPVLEAERSKTWYNLGRQLGYADDDAVAFAEYLNRIVELTSMQAVYRSLRAGAWDTGRAPTAAATTPPP